MPFQPNTAQFLQFLQQQRDAKLQAQQDTMKAALAERKNRLDAVTRVGKEQRAQAIHNIKLQREELALAKEQAEQQDSVTSDARSAEAAVPGIATDMQSEPGFGNTQAAAELEASGLRGSDQLPGAPNTFAGIVQGLDPNLASEGSQDAAAGTLFSKARERAFAPLIDRATKAGAENVQDLIRISDGREAVRKQDEAEKAEVEVDRVIEAEKRANVEASIRADVTNARAIDAAQRIVDASVDRPTAQMANLSKKASVHSKRANDPNLTEEERADSAALATILKDEIQTRHLRSLGDEGVKESRRVQSSLADYRRLWTMNKVFEGVYARSDSLLSVGASLTQIYNHMSGILGDISGIVSDDFRQNITKYTDKEQEMLGNLFANGILPDGTLLVEAQLAEVSAAWWLMRSLNPSGRVSQKQIQQIIDIVTSTGIFTPSNIGAFKTKATTNIFGRELFNKRQDLKGDNIEFTDDGRIATDDPPPPLGLLAPLSENAIESRNRVFTNPRDASNEDRANVINNSPLGMEGLNAIKVKQDARAVRPGVHQPSPRPHSKFRQRAPAQEGNQ